MRDLDLLTSALSSTTHLTLDRRILSCAALLIALVGAAGCEIGEFGPGADGLGPGDVDPGEGLGGSPGGDPLFRGCDGQSPAHDTFNAFWSTLDARYAVFDARLPDTRWAAVGSVACARIAAGMSDAALYDVLLGMARQLDDGHTEIVAEQLARDDDGWVSVYPFYEQLYTLEGNAEARYIGDDLTYAAEDEIAWGLIGDIAYVSITSMEDLSPSGEEGDDRAAANQALATVMADVGDARGMIVDIRANEGGFDTVSLDIASWFAGSRRVAWTEQVRSGPGHADFAPPVNVFVEATRPGGFTGPVVLLTSGGTFSAAETFALAMRVRDNVTLVGEPTSGHLSDLIDGSLPNGWEFSYSGERYIAADGQLYEARGIPVDRLVAFDPAALTSGRDIMLEQALAVLGR